MKRLRDGSTTNPLVLQGQKTIALFGGVFLFYLVSSYFLFDVVTDFATLRELAIDSYFWLLLAIAIPALHYFFTGEFLLTPFLGGRIFSLWCLACMYLPLLYSTFVDVPYAEIAGKDFSGWYDIAAFLSFCLYWAFKWDLFSEHSHVHLEKQR